MIDLNEMIIAQIKERDALFPDVSKGVLVPMVCLSSADDVSLGNNVPCLYMSISI